MIFGKKNRIIDILFSYSRFFFRMSNRKILELEATLKDTTSLAENTTEITDLKKSLNRATTRHEEESSRTKIQIDELQKRLDIAGNRIFNSFKYFFPLFF